MITLEHLTYFYKGCPVAAVSDATASIAPGIHLLLGENGAGKTTLLHIIAGLLYPTEGRVEIDGMEPRLRQPSTMRKIFFVSDTVDIPTSTINSFAKIHSPFYPSFDVGILSESLRRMGQTGDENFYSLSYGNRKKAMLCYALAVRADVLLLDEPANGLDITSKQILQQMFAEFIGESQTVIISTHTPSEFAYLFDGIIVLNRSNLLLAMPTWQITERVAFGTGMLPPVSPLYMEQRMGLFRYITTADPEKPTDVDFLSLYNGLLSPAAPAIVTQLKTPTGNE